jgi:CRP-like cAMP-binding protein
MSARGSGGRYGEAAWPTGTALGDLSETDRGALLSLGAFREYPAGDTLIQAGDASRSVIALSTGWVKVFGTTANGGKALLGLRSRGDLVGEQAALENAPRSASVIAAMPVTAYLIQQPDFLRYLSGHGDAGLTMSRALSAKLRWASDRQVDFAGLPGHVQLARVLCELAVRNGVRVADGIKIGYPLSQADLGGLISASEPKTQRALRTLRGLSLVASGYRGVVITDLLGLTAVADSAAGDSPPDPII